MIVEFGKIMINLFRGALFQQVHTNLEDEGQIFLVV